MKNAKLRMVGLSAGLLALLATTSAFAQDPPPAAAPAAEAPPPPPPPAQAQATASGQVGMGLPGAAPQTAIAAPAAGGTDHSLVVGHLGFGYLGRPGVTVGAGATVVNAPVVGVRYWLDPGLGIDVGLGFGLQSNSQTAGGTSNDGPSYWAFVVHGGVPLALATGRHYTFQIVPEANIGLGGGSTTMGGGDVSHSGFLLDLGARAGAEIQFGFIGLPELALQGSVGAMFALQSYSSTPDGGEKSGQSNLSLNTTVFNSPWGIFTNSLSALYYF
ncbi:MAG: hypothetical protein ACOY0T_32460 [Myxococcota bacterium]